MPQYRVLATGERTFEITLNAKDKLEALHALTCMLVSRRENVSGEVDAVAVFEVIDHVSKFPVHAFEPAGPDGDLCRFTRPIGTLGQRQHCSHTEDHEVHRK